MSKISVILRSIWNWLKEFFKDFGEPGVIQQARVGRAMGILRDHRKEQLKNATYTNLLEGYQRELQQIKLSRQIDEEKMRVLWDKISDLQVQFEVQK